MQSIDIVDVLLALIHLSLHPVAIEVPEEIVVVLRSIRVPLPFSDVVGQKRLVTNILGFARDKSQMGIEVLIKKLVELLTKQVCTSVALSQRSRGVCA